MKRSSPGLDSTLSSFIPSDLEENSSRARLQRETKRNDLEEDHEKGCFDLGQRERGIFSSAHLFGSVNPFSREQKRKSVVFGEMVSCCEGCLQVGSRVAFDPWVMQHFFELNARLSVPGDEFFDEIAGLF